jgi:hypothetical protein
MINQSIRKVNATSCHYYYYYYYLDCLYLLIYIIIIIIIIIIITIPPLPLLPLLHFHINSNPFTNFFAHWNHTIFAKNISVLWHDTFIRRLHAANR